jgi:hypothetical protein
MKTVLKMYPQHEDCTQNEDYSKCTPSMKTVLKMKTTQNVPPA